MTKRVSVPGRKVRSSQCRDLLEHREAAHAVAAELGLDVDVVDDLGREDAALPEELRVALGGSFLAAGAALASLLSFCRHGSVFLAHYRAPASSRPARDCRSSTAACRRRSWSCCSTPLGASSPYSFSLRSSHCTSRSVISPGTASTPRLGDLAADVDRAVVHRIAEVLAGVAEDDHAAALHHEAGERAGAAADDDRAALHVDADARADVALADEIAAAERRAERASRRSSR